MPYKPKVSCKYPLCSELIETGERFCPSHKQPTSEYEKKRNSINSKVYNTTWRRLRRLKLNNNPLCERCLAKGKVIQAEEVDHVISVSQQPELLLVMDNLQSLCTPCHSKKTRAENKKI
jgi:5-methylcytosine-specific restriction protein A